MIGRMLGIPYDEAESIGCIALARALQTYDAKKGLFPAWLWTEVYKWIDMQYDIDHRQKRPRCISIENHLDRLTVEEISFWDEYEIDRTRFYHSVEMIARDERPILMMRLNGAGVKEVAETFGITEGRVSQITFDQGRRMKELYENIDIPGH